MLMMVTVVKAQKYSSWIMKMTVSAVNFPSESLLLFTARSSMLYEFANVKLGGRCCGRPWWWWWWL